MNAIRPLSLLAAALLAALTVSGCRRDEAPPPAAIETPPPAPPPPMDATPAPVSASAIAHVAGAGGTPAKGDITVVAMGDGVHFNGTIAGLVPDSEHGFHLHETGDCSDFANGSAGKHLNPSAQPHGAPDSTAHHAGDMPNLHADASGNAVVDVHLSGVNLGTGDGLDVVGRALVVHEGNDDYATQPSGDSGTPIACGVIETQEAAPAPASTP
jgi:Cu-Zn family superoxide dismutase